MGVKGLNLSILFCYANVIIRHQFLSEQQSVHINNHPSENQIFKKIYLVRATIFMLISFHDKAKVHLSQLNQQN